MLGTECTNKIVPQNLTEFKTKDLEHPNPIERTGTLGFNALNRTDSPTRARRARSSSPRPAFETFSERHPTAPRPPASAQARPVLGGSVAAAGAPACLLRRLGPKPPPAPPHAEILGFCNFISHSNEEQSSWAVAVQEYLLCKAS